VKSRRALQSHCRWRDGEFSSILDAQERARRAMYAGSLFALGVIVDRPRGNGRAPAQEALSYAVSSATSTAWGHGPRQKQQYQPFARVIPARVTPPHRCGVPRSDPWEGTHHRRDHRSPLTPLVGLKFNQAMRPATLLDGVATCNPHRWIRIRDESDDFPEFLRRFVRAGHGRSAHRRSPRAPPPSQTPN